MVELKKLIMLKLYYIQLLPPKDANIVRKADVQKGDGAHPHTFYASNIGARRSDPLVNDEFHGGFQKVVNATTVLLPPTALKGAMVAQGAAESFSSPIISNARVPNVLCHHDLSKVHGEDGMVMEAQRLAEFLSPSIWNDNISNVHGRAREDDLIHDTYSTQSWVDRAKEGEFIPQVALDLEAEFRGFSEDPSFLMDSFHGVLSSPSLRGRRNLNNGSHGGLGGAGGSARVARGIQTTSTLSAQIFAAKGDVPSRPK
ncbi:hypothetical protein F0562_025424 [Nyssa sinensis]|uniref:Uncharacterized protein n=1 Tax=Nyssa sinensis TaxID=561372 RepID=A0A5J5BJX0_9ASTE|nr:hypothetical protein F0562_025424 [Nyssa sinensis]